MQAALGLYHAEGSDPFGKDEERGFPRLGQGEESVEATERGEDYGVGSGHPRTHLSHPRQEYIQLS